MSLKSDPNEAAPVRSWSLATRLTVWYAVSSFLLVVLATLTLYLALVQNLEREDVLTLRDQVRVLRQVLQNGPAGVETIRRDAEWVWAARQASLVHVRILDASGQHVVETPEMSGILPAELFPPPASAEQDPGDGMEFRRAGRSYRLVSARTAADRYIVQVALDETPDEELIAAYRRNLAIVLALALVACTVGGYRIARRGVRPIHSITDTARRVHPAHLDERISSAGLPAELCLLAQTFNGMLDRLAEAFARLARFSADLAHELRTPINNLRGEIEVTLGKPRSVNEYRDALGSALEECARLSRMIDGLLFLARAEHPAASIESERLELAAELETVRAFYEISAAEAGIRLDVRCAAGLHGCLDRVLFQRAIGNLVTNALAHTPRGGTIAITARQTLAATSVEVADSGCGIEAAHLPFLFDRFYRVDRARSSAAGNLGLGLAIVKGIIDLHGGSIEVTSQPGAGTCVTLHFPNPEAASPT